MNRLAAEVVDNGACIVDCRGVRLTVHAVRGRPLGQRVLVLVRPESLEVQPLPDAEAPPGVLVGRVISHAFLGAITRIKIATESGDDLAADIPSARAGAFPIGTRVVCRFPADGPRALTLPSS
jgi:ABC-type Fe3+/spermidine/putrescine transport system ATPase subunit